MRRAWVRIATGVFQGAVFLAIFIPMVRGWPTLRQHLQTAHGGYLAASWFLLSGVILSIAAVWTTIARYQGVRVPFHRMVNLYTRTSLAGRLPGPIGSLAAAASFGDKAGLSPWQAVGVVLYGQAYLIISGLLFLALLSCSGVRGGVWGFVPAGMGFSLFFLLLLAIHPRILRALFSWVLRRRGQSARLPPACLPRRARRRQAEAAPDASACRLPVRWVPFGAALIQVGVHCFSWLLSGWAFFLFVQWTTGPLAGNLFLPISAAFCASHLAGMLSLFAPQGFGMREGALTLLLSPLVPVSVAGWIALSARIWTTLGVLGIFLIGRWRNG